MTDATSYVYIYLDKTKSGHFSYNSTFSVISFDFEPFYIGKGKNLRYLPCCHINGDHYFIENKIKKLGIENIEIKFLNENLTDQQSIELEKYWIKLIGRRDLGLGPLCNLTDGGDGSSGHIQSIETKTKRSNAMKSLIAQGKVFTEEHRRKISEGKKGQKMPDSVKEVLRKANLGRPSNMLGKKHSEETKKAWSLKRRGSLAHNSKLKEQDIIDIRKLSKGKISNLIIAKMYNVNPCTISNIVKKRSWKHVIEEKET